MELNKARREELLKKLETRKNSFVTLIKVTKPFRQYQLIMHNKKLNFFTIKDAFLYAEDHNLNIRIKKLGR